VTRKAFPYTPFPGPNVPEGTKGRLPMDVPDLIFRNHYGTLSETRRGELGNTKGSLTVIIPIESVYNSGPDSVRGASHNKSRGVVPTPQAQGTIRKPIIISRNLFSPTAHRDDPKRLALSGAIPPPAVMPSKDRGMPPKMGKRGSGGHFTYPAPQVVPVFPTATDWLHGRFGR
jgi:hypothetical protein